jgi:hypothetical protein
MDLFIVSPNGSLRKRDSGNDINNKHKAEIGIEIKCPYPGKE